MHNIQIKNFVKQINIKKNYKKKILDTNIEKFDLIIKNNIDMFFFIKTLIKQKKNLVLKINFVNSAKNIINN